ncbi:MAG: hypothetical protein ABI650_09855 [Dokdonella sp.]
MSTRKPPLFLALLLLLSCSTAVHAGTYAMSSDALPVSVDVVTSPEPARFESAGGDSSSRYMLGVDASSESRADSASPSNDDSGSTAPTAAANVSGRVGAPASATPASRPRSGNRWQSLVPGAIK